MHQFWELLKQSVIIQGLITVMLIGTICYLALSGKIIPQFIEDITALVIGFYFGAKVQNLVNRSKV